MDADELSALIGGIYAAAMDGAGWSGFLQRLSRSLGIEAASFVISDPRIGHSSVTAPDADPAVIAAYTRHWWEHDPTALATNTVAPGVVTTLEYTGRERFLKSAYYNEFWRQSGLGADRAAANLVTDGGAFVSIALHAKPRRDEITAETTATLSRIVPHLIQAVAIQRRFWRLELERTALGQIGGNTNMGFFVVDAGARVIHCDGRGRGMLGGLLRLDEDVLLAGTDDTTATLHAMIASCAGMSAERPSGGRMGGNGVLPGFAIEVVPFPRGLLAADRYELRHTRPVALVLVKDLAAEAQNRRIQLQARFGLTAAESAIALEMLGGDGRDAAAARLGISVSTVRTHLSRIFEKTGVNRQAELVRLLLTAIGN
jgi:DNA-binding CsgD family transcriptional regulator